MPTVYSQKRISDGAYELNFVFTKKMNLALELGADNLWRVYAKINNGSRIILRRIYLHVHGGSFWKPNVEEVELKGMNPVLIRKYGKNLKINKKIAVK